MVTVYLLHKIVLIWSYAAVAQLSLKGLKWLTIKYSVLFSRFKNPVKTKTSIWWALYFLCLYLPALALGCNCFC